MRIRFGSFVFDSGSRELVQQPSRAAAASHPIHLSPKAFDVLEILVARRPNVVYKEMLLGEVWPGKVVEEANLAIVIGEIRKALGDDPKAPAIVLTVPRRGYRFAATCEPANAAGTFAGENGSGEAQAGVQLVRSWLTWNDKTLPLHHGENYVGRHPACTIWINAASVSRNHARIVATADTVLIEDRGSRNGTFVDGKKITAPHVLVDGSTVTFGSEVATFRQWSDDAAAGTEPVRR